jgi:hypothetical protein
MDAKTRVFLVDKRLKKVNMPVDKERAKLDTITFQAADITLELEQLPELPGPYVFRLQFT